MKHEEDTIVEFLNNPETKRMWEEQEVRNRKAEIKRIAEQIYLKHNTGSVRDALKYAIRFVDNFEAEFKRLEENK